MHHKTAVKLARLTTFIQQHYAHWEESYPNLSGAYSGMKKRNGEPTGRYAIVFKVVKKEPSPVYPIPKYFEVNTGEGVKKIPTDIVVSGKMQLRNARMGNEIEESGAGESGTIGLFLEKGGHVFACTNAHVVMENEIYTGRMPFFVPVSQQYQPDVTLYDDSGNSFRAYRQEGIFDGVDAALCRLDDVNGFSNEISGFGMPSGIKEIKDGDEGYALVKMGNKTGKTSGTVIHVGVTMPTPVDGIHMHNLIEARLHSEGGDSGSPVFNSALKLIGIIVGGYGSSTYITPMNEILKSLECELYQ